MRMCKPKEAKRINLAAIPLDVLLVRCILMMHSEIYARKIAFSLNMADFQMPAPRQVESERNDVP